MRILLDQRDRDRADGINSAGFVSGYRGSPLGGVDLELWRAKKPLADRRIEFLPAVNEDLAATAMLGSQQVETSPDARRSMACSASGTARVPGVDRSGDALKHGNAYGSSPHGGVLVVAGDDHGCVSSSMPHQSDVAFMAWFMPTLNPASVAEYLSFGEYGYALSRFFQDVGRASRRSRKRSSPAPRSSCRRAASSIRRRSNRRRAVCIIAGRIFPVRRSSSAWKPRRTRCWPLPPPIRSTAGSTIFRTRHYGIVTTGKGHLDLMEALQLLGLDRSPNAARLGIDIYKVGMVWPLAHHDALEFVREQTRNPA